MLTQACLWQLWYESTVVNSDDFAKEDVSLSALPHCQPCASETLDGDGPTNEVAALSAFKQRKRVPSPFATNERWGLTISNLEGQVLNASKHSATEEVKSESRQAGRRTGASLLQVLVVLRSRTLPPSESNLR